MGATATKSIKRMLKKFSLVKLSVYVELPVDRGGYAPSAFPIYAYVSALSNFVASQ